MTTAVLDANALYGALIRDLLLRLAVRELYRPVWTAEILEELQRALLRNRPLAAAGGVPRLLHAMTSSFPGALVAPSPEDTSRVPVAIEPGDRHVVAAAVATEADVIVTENLRHFPGSALEPLGISAVSIDDFLCRFLAVDPEAVKRTLEEISLDYSKPPRTLGELLEALARVAPKFAESIVNDEPTPPSETRP